MMFDYAALQRSIDEVRSKEIFFVMGVMKSGTTWLQLALNGHSQIACRGEGQFTNYLSRALRKALKAYNKEIEFKNEKIFGEVGGYPLLQREHELFLAATAAALLMAEYGRAEGVKAVGERTPDNILNGPTLMAFFPGAKFIHIVRDPRDCAVSGWFHNLRVTPEWAKKTYPTFADYAKIFSALWLKQVETGRSFGRDNPASYIELRYEDIHADAPREILRLLEFLGVETGSSFVESCREAGSFEKNSGGRRRGEENKDSHFRSGKVGGWRDHMADDDMVVFQSVAGDLMAELGYG